jgi:hypothetical protein
MFLLLFVDEKVDLDLFLFEVVLTADDKHHAGDQECESETGRPRCEHLDCKNVVDGNGEDGFEARGHISDERGEYLIHQDIAHDEIQSQHDRNIEDIHEVLFGEQPEYSPHWVEAELVPAEEIPENYEVDRQADIVDQQIREPGRFGHFVVALEVENR